MNYQERLSDLKELIKEIEYLRDTMNSLVYWDKITYMPRKGIDYRARVMSFLADEQYKRLSSERFNSHVRYFAEREDNDEITDAMISNILKDSMYIQKIPEDEYSEYTRLIAVSEQIWEEARRQNDFAILNPYLERIFGFFRSFAEYWGYEKDPYDALIEYYMEGLTTELVDQIVGYLKPVLMDMLSRIKDSEEYHNEHPLIIKGLSKDEQLDIWEELLSDLGFDLEAGRVDIGEHPTILANSSNDVRIVNTYREDGLMTGIFNILHACGKGIYHQSIDPSLEGTMLGTVPSFAFEEAIGRLYENVLGRCRGFWEYFKTRYEKSIPELKKYSSEELFLNANRVRPSNIRVDADQVTYLLHIIIRYELERGLISGKINTDELPKLWKGKYEKYLGIAPETLEEGVLQDIHWPAGYVGYFPTYFVSSLAAAQLADAMERDFGSIDSIASKGEFGLIKDWLSEKVFKFGAIYPSAELIKRATGSELTSEPFIDYLRRKYSEVYKLDF